MELAGIGLRIARVAAEVAEVERRVVALLATGLPDEYGKTASLHDGQMAGLAVDAVDAALKEALAADRSGRADVRAGIARGAADHGADPADRGRVAAARWVR